MIQQPPRALLDRDVIIHISPSENIRLRRNDIDIALLFVVTNLSALLCSTSLFIVLLLLIEHVLGNMTSAEDKDLSSAGSLGVDLDCNKVQGHESEEESKQDTEVAPDVAVVVSIAGREESVSIDSRAALNRAFGRADELVAGEVGIGGDELGASEFAAVELVGHEDFEGVVDGVDPADPACAGSQYCTLRF